MNDMHEFSTFKDLITSVLHISTDESTHPVICDNYWRKDFQLAKNLQSSKCEEDKLLWHIHCAFSIIGFREKLRVMEPNIVYATVFSSMYSELVLKSWAYDFYIPLINKSLFCQIICLFLFVIFVIRSNYIHFFSYSCQLFGKFINHDT